MKAGWSTKPLDAVLLKTETINPMLKPKQSFKYVDVSSVSNQSFEITMTQDLLGEEAPSRARKLIRENDVLFATIRPTLQRVAIVPSELDGEVCSTGYFVLRASPEIDPRFLFYSLFTVDFQQQMSALQKGASYPAVTDGEVRSQPISFPKLPAQKRIVAILDEAFDGIATAKANAQKNLQNARELFERHLECSFLQLVTECAQKQLSEVCDLQNGYAFKSTSYIEHSNTLNIRMSSIRPGGTFDAEHNQRFLPDSFAKEFSSYLLKDGDLIIAMTDMAGDPKILGVPTLVEGRDDRNFLMNQRVGKLYKFSEGVLIPYLRYFLTSPAIRNFYKSKGAGGLQINISKGDILSAKIPVPSIEIQSAIIAQYDALASEVDNLESLYQQKLAALDELKKSLLHEAFSEKL